MRVPPTLLVFLSLRVSNDRANRLTNGKTPVSVRLQTVVRACV